MMRKDGRRFVGEITIAPVRDQSPGGEVSAWVSTVRDISSRHDYQIELERLATHDPLTGLANRRLFDERLEQELATRSGTSARWEWRSSTSTSSRPSTISTATPSATVRCARRPSASRA